MKVLLASLQKFASLGKVLAAGVGPSDRSVTSTAGLGGLVLWVLCCCFLISVVGFTDASKSNVRAVHEKHTHGGGG